ncbi:hypothetical protein TNIN_269281 [Trichonephila inaurata madagascariensis]|uniref:Uncharacterized protein n=1 Tax=Trichonephila inaurata madagascariensis TaxID=2747483 RepID=A0A8X6Y8R1_9ARAC|nr:hypothetical protein TNIN_269281 [Trichonephila inaurata madagascariensis]
MDKTRYLKKLSPFTQRSYISETSGQISTLSFETTLIKGTKYTFLDDNGKEFVIDNADFEKEKKELIYIFNSNPIFLSNNSNFEMRSYNETFYFIPIPTDASPYNSIDENNITDNASFEEEEKE